MKSRTRVRLAVLFLVPVLVLAVYTALVIRSGQARTERLLVQVDELGRVGLQPSALPADWLAELLTVEDPGFYDHHGIDLTTPGAGMTTLTQSLVKIHYFETFKPGLAKYKQSVLALVLDARMSKEQQLLLFLNTVGFGNLEGQKISGFANAAEAYFAKSFHLLNHDEFLSLVAMLVGPNAFNVSRNPRKNAERVARIKSLLAGACVAKGLTDVYYAECASKSVS